MVTIDIKYDFQIQVLTVNGFGRKNTPGLRRGLRVLGRPAFTISNIRSTVPLVFLPDFFIREIQVRLLRDLNR